MEAESAAKKAIALFRDAHNAARATPSEKKVAAGLHALADAVRQLAEDVTHLKDDVSGLEDELKKHAKR